MKNAALKNLEKDHDYYADFKEDDEDTHIYEDTIDLVPNPDEF